MRFSTTRYAIGNVFALLYQEWRLAPPSQYDIVIDQILYRVACPAKNQIKLMDNLPE